MAKRRKATDFTNNFMVFGGALAMIISYSDHHKIWLAIVHGILSWFYVLYYAIFHVWF